MTVTNSKEHDLLKLETMTKQLRIKHQTSFPTPARGTNSHDSEGMTNTPAHALGRVTTAVRFIVRLRIAAREWRKQEALRKVLVSKWDEYEKRGMLGNTGGPKKPVAPTAAPPLAFSAGGGGFKKIAVPASLPSAAIVGGGGGFKKPAVPTFAPPAAFVGGFKKPAAARSNPGPSAYLKEMDLRERVEMSKRNRAAVDSELDEVESSAAPLGFDVDSSSRAQEDNQAAQDWGELDGTEAFTVDSL